ncbi:MAG TPA: toll/interleukin-1 receptor domain-containing protein [Solirubrobacteraceae bacterium]|jgi:hypothetical protein
MKIFVSWSGDKSRQVAVVLREWLPAVINSVEPFVSSKDIDPGTRWQMEVAGQLESTSYGIVCVTRDNQSAPWLNFEAGALAKVVETGRVVPLAVDLKPSDVTVPLGQFQAQPATEQGIREIVTSINSACASRLSDDLLERAFQKWWPDLSESLSEIEKNSTPGPARNSPRRSDRELLEEMLNTVRSLAQAPPSISSRPWAADEMLPENHPLVGELESLLKDMDCTVIRARGGRRLGITVREKLPSTLRDAIRQRAELYGVDVKYMRAGRPSRSAQAARQSSASS